MPHNLGQKAAHIWCRCPIILDQLATVFWNIVPRSDVQGEGHHRPVLTAEGTYKGSDKMDRA